MRSGGRNRVRNSDSDAAPVVRSARPGRGSLAALSLDDVADRASIEAITRDLGSKLYVLGRTRAVASALRTLRWFLLTALAALVALMAYRAALASHSINLADYATMDAIFALGVVVFLELRASRSNAAARRSYHASEDRLTSIVAEHSGRAHGELLELRRRMQQRIDLGAAILAAFQARDLTIRTLRFLRNVPTLSVSGDDIRAADRCDLLKQAVKSAATSAIAQQQRYLVRMLLVALGCILGAGMFALSVATPYQLAPPPAFVMEALKMEQAFPGALSIPAALVAMVALASFGASGLYELSTARSVTRLFDANETKALVSDLQARLLERSAERPDELIERYADAELALLQQAGLTSAALRTAAGGR